MDEPKVIREAGMQEAVRCHRDTLERGWRRTNKHDRWFCGLFQRYLHELGTCEDFVRRQKHTRRVALIGDALSDTLDAERHHV